MKRAAQSERSDAELVQRARTAPESPEGQEAAAQLLTRYQGRVYLRCLRYVGNREEALDLAQDVLLSTYRHLGSFGERAQFSSWLFAITRNRCLSALRRPPLLIDEDAPPESIAAPDPGPDRDLEQREEENRVRELMRRHLTVCEQEALWLRCFEHMPIDEITRVLGIEAASGARAVLQSARRKLRQALGSTRRIRGS